MELIIAMTYGRALFDAAVELERIDEINEEIVQVGKIFEEEQDYFSLLTNPAIPMGKKKTLIRNVFEGKISPEVLSFLIILQDKGRMFYYKMIVREYIRLMDVHLGVAEGVIYSAVPLSDGQRAKFEMETGKLMKEKIQLKNEIDKSLIGGVKVLVDGKLIDASLRGRLNDLKFRLKEI